MRYILTLFVLSSSLSFATAQFGYGVVITNDIYQRYSNPESSLGDQYGSAGSFLLNLGIGPKIWMGGSDVSFSLESQLNWGIAGLAVSDFKGIGMLSVPLIGRLNFKGLSALDKEGRFGFTIGGGVQWSKTELYYLSNGAEEDGVTRDFFRTYIGEFGYGFGISGFTLHPYVRYGYNPDDKSNVFHLGIRYDLNLRQLKEIQDPNSDL